MGWGQAVVQMSAQSIARAISEEVPFCQHFRVTRYYMWDLIDFSFGFEDPYTSEVFTLNFSVHAEDLAGDGIILWFQRAIIRALAERKTHHVG